MAGRPVTSSSPSLPAPIGEGGHADQGLVRFDAAERAAHWLLAVMFLVLLFTGAALYLPSLVGLVGRHRLVERVHVDVGLALPLPLLVSLAGSWGKGLRADLRRLNRWSLDDRRWLACACHARVPRGLRTGKFNAGQKLNAAFLAGALLVMLMTGSVMHWEYYWPLSWRTGATVVHESLAYVLVVVVAGHIIMALAHPPALRSMLAGRVSRRWAERHAPAWLEEMEAGPTERS